MKTFFITTLAIFIFSGCSTYNAFSDFNLTRTQEKSEDSIQSAKINAKKRSIGLLSAIYLNRVYPTEYKDGEYFYISLYIQNKEKSVDFLLNNKLAVEVTQLQINNQFSDLMASDIVWKEYYLVKFQEDRKKSLTLKVKNSYLLSNKLEFQKEN